MVRQRGERAVDFLARHRGSFVACLLVVTFGGLLYLAFFQAPSVIVPSDIAPETQRVKLENDVRTTAVQVLAGSLVLAGLALTARSIAVTREGQLTERFSRAIEHLGNDKPDVRLGGIYALERIARNSREDHGPVFDVLTAYIREHTPWPLPEPADRRAQLPNEPAGATLRVCSL